MSKSKLAKLNLEITTFLNQKSLLNFDDCKWKWLDISVNSDLILKLYVDFTHYNNIMTKVASPKYLFILC